MYIEFNISVLMKKSKIETIVKHEKPDENQRSAEAMKLHHKSFNNAFNFF